MPDLRKLYHHIPETLRFPADYLYARIPEEIKYGEEYRRSRLCWSNPSGGARIG